MRSLLRLLLAAGLGWAGWAMLSLWGRDRTTVGWWCDAEGCGSDDLASVAPLLGVAACALLVPVLVRFLDRATFGAVMAFGGLATWSGLRRSVDLGLSTEAETSGWVTVTLVLVGVGGLLAVVGGLRSVVRSGVLLRLAGRASAPARVRVRQSGSQTVVSLAFRSTDGTLHDVPVPKNPRVGSQRVVALYDPAQPDWPGRVRVGLLRAPGTAAGRAQWERRLADLPPLAPDAPSGRRRTPTTTLPTAAGSGRPSRAAAPPLARADQIRRLDALRAAGQITTAQADQAAAQVLAGLFRATFPTTRR